MALTNQQKSDLFDLQSKKAKGMGGTDTRRLKAIMAEDRAKTDEQIIAMLEADVNESNAKIDQDIEALQARKR